MEGEALQRRSVIVRRSFLNVGGAAAAGPLGSIDDAALRARVRQTTQVDDAIADKLVAACRNGRPNSNNVDIALILASDLLVRPALHAQVDRKIALSSSPMKFQIRPDPLAK